MLSMESKYVRVGTMEESTIESGTTGDSELEDIGVEVAKGMEEEDKEERDGDDREELDVGKAR